MNPMKQLRHAWNLFANEDSLNRRSPTGYGTTLNQNRPIFTRGNEKTIVTTVYNRLSVDAAAIDIRHVRLDSQNRYSDDMDTTLNYCLTQEANIDQTSRAFIQDVIISMFDEGYVAIVPVETSKNPENLNSFDVESLRTGRILEWYPTMVRVRLYNQLTGNKEDVLLPKNMVCIIENPFYSIMNEPNSTMQRLITKLNMLDNVDKEVSSGNLDLIIQLPYAVKTEAKRAIANERRQEIEDQLNGAKYGVAYIDGAEKVTQLNRPLENNLLRQIEYLTALLYSQLGITQSILDGTADENTMNNYYNRIIEPILGAIVEEMNRKFLSKTARTQKQTIMYFRDPFKLMPISSVAEIADKFTRNEVMTSNEMRQAIGMKPSDDPSADELRNKNLSQSSEAIGEKKVNNNKEDVSNE